MSAPQIIRFAMCFVAALAIGPLATAEDLHARVSFESGGGLVRGSADADWSFAGVNTIVLPGDTLWADNEATLELEIPGGSFLRLADGSKAEIVSFGDAAAFRGWTGAFYIQRLNRSTGTLVFQTPACQLEVDRDTQVRVDILESGSTTVTVRWGRVNVSTESGTPLVVAAGKRTYIDPGLLPSAPLPFDRDAVDDFDVWHQERARLLAVGSTTLPRAVSIDDSVMGVSDLGAYGEWVYVERVPYWRPTVVVDYVPYRTGHWSYVPAYGYCWVGNYPFSYVTGHYGRWTYNHHYGWLWRYTSGWGPAWCATARVGDNFVWAPLDYYDRPVVYGSARFNIGGVSFSFSTSSYCSANDLFYGPAPVYGYTPTIWPSHNQTNVYIWNIYAPNYRPSRQVNFGSTARVRDFAPDRIIRGPVADTRQGMLAAERVTTLENRSGRSEFRAVQTTGGRNIRTPLSDDTRIARSRSVRVNPEAVEQATDIARRVERGDLSPRSETARAIRASGRNGAEAPSASVDPTRSLDSGGHSGGPAETDTTRVSPDRSRAIRDRSNSDTDAGPRFRTPAEGGASTAARARTVAPDRDQTVDSTRRTLPPAAFGRGETSRAVRAQESGQDSVRMTQPPQSQEPSRRTVAPQTFGRGSETSRAVRAQESTQDSVRMTQPPQSQEPPRRTIAPQTFGRSSDTSRASRAQEAQQTPTRTAPPARTQRTETSSQPAASRIEPERQSVRFRTSNPQVTLPPQNEPATRSIRPSAGASVSPSTRTQTQPRESSSIYTPSRRQTIATPRRQEVSPVQSAPAPREIAPIRSAPAPRHTAPLPSQASPSVQYTPPSNNNRSTPSISSSPIPSPPQRISPPAPSSGGRGSFSAPSPAPSRPTNVGTSIRGASPRSR